MARALRALPCPTGPEVLDVWMPALAAALDGSGSALVPVPAGPAGPAVTAMARLDEPVDAGAPGAFSDGVVLVVPTSGSTGIPKGALLTAAALRASGEATQARTGGPGRWLLALPVTHVAGQQVLLRSLLAGTSPEVLDLAGGFDPAAFATATDRLGAARRYTSLVPTQLGRLLDAGGPAVEALRSYATVLLGGAAAPPALLDRAAAAGARVLTTYGMSETCGGCVYSGIPLEGVRVRLGDDGRIALGGAVVFSGYRLRPDLTAEALEVDADGVRWHLTRDVGRLDGERLEIVGRVDDLIVTGAEKVAPLAVEAAIAALPAVRDVVVVGAPDPDWGQRVVAVVTPADPDRPPSLPGLRDALRDALPVHALPQQLQLVGAIPLLASGKPDRAGVRAGLPAGG